MGGIVRKGLLLSVLMPAAFSQTCIPLSGSTQCPAFQAASVSTDSNVSGLFPFLSYVSSTETFDQQFMLYINSSYVKTKYQTLLGCSKVDLTNTSSYYARYATSVLCNAIVQNSIGPCGLTGNATQPLCASDCAQHAISEEEIVSNNQLCGTPGSDFVPQIRADFVTCSLPDNSLTGNCITGEQNEPNNCGYANNLEGLCRFCGTSTINATDSCCYGSNAVERCSGVVLPTLSPMPNITYPSNNATSTPSASSSAAASSNTSTGLSGGAIAGIVIGSIVGALMLAALLAFCFLAYRRHRNKPRGYSLNQPSPRRSQPSLVPNVNGTSVGRVARLSALEGNTIGEKNRGLFDGISDSDSPDDTKHLGVAPVASRRRASLSSNSILGMEGDSSPNNQMSSPEGVHSQSEQLPFFKDYYSNDDIHPGDMVATLWAYQPRAADEFDLGRGDMLKVVGIWDDGWATGIRVTDRAEDYDGKVKRQRDSGVSNVHRERTSPEPQGDVKAFPLVCVCLPDHWRKTIEGGGDSSTESTSPARQFDTRFPNF